MLDASIMHARAGEMSQRAHQTVTNVIVRTRKRSAMQVTVKMKVRNMPFIV